MKIKNLKVAALLMAGTMMTSSCIGSYSLFNKFADWNCHATGSKFLNAIIGVVLLPVYGICSFADALLFNTIEFWSGDNPIASNVGKTQQVMGQDGRYYAVKTLKDGYEITNPEGEMLKFIHDQKNDSWSQIQNGEVREIFRFNHDGTIRVTLSDGQQMNVGLDEAGLHQVRMAAGGGTYWAMR
ncbi:MAG: DUF3332 domain-containing protein [Prevotella sp.]|nr:DUF3332 domain-containing protein [Prevotella sp.]